MLGTMDIQCRHPFNSTTTATGINVITIITTTTIIIIISTIIIIIIALQVYAYTITCLTTGSNFEAAVDVIITVLHRYRCSSSNSNNSSSSSSGSSNDMSLVTSLIPYVVALRTVWNSQILQLSEDSDDDDMNVCRCISRLFTELSGTNIVTITIIITNYQHRHQKHALKYTK